jgi:uncharacterized protein (TIGR02145 family)
MHDVTLHAAVAALGPITFSNTSFCGASTFTAEVAPVPGATSYEWTLPSGLSFDGASDVSTITIAWTTEGVYPAGSISVRARTSSCVSTPSASTQDVKVGATPAKPTGGSVSNSGNTFTFGVTSPPANHEIDWYDAAIGGTKVATGTSFSTTLTASKTYYAESRNTTTDCVSDSRLPVQAVVLRSVSGCEVAHSYGGSVITSANVDFINDAEYERHGITLSAPVKIVGRSAKTSLASATNTVDYRDHQVSNTDPTINTADYGSWFTWCMVATHADILCPSPWRVPSREDFCKYANDNESSTGSTTEVKSGMHGWLLGGYADGNSVYGVGSVGYYWSSTEGSSSSGYNAYVTSSGFYPSSSSGRYGGFSLRCVR